MDNREKRKVLIIYTGGTIGMVENPNTGALENFGLHRFLEMVPELGRMDYHISLEAFDPPIDSSDMEPIRWKEIAEMIVRNYETYDGFVILHGTDTMAYTASALSFMLENIAKPVIITGSQLPIGQLRTDGKENLLTSVEIAAACDASGRPIVPEVCIYFDSRLMRGNRTTKINTDEFNAFQSYNYPPLATAGIDIRFNARLIRPIPTDKPLRPHLELDDRVMVLSLFPGIRQDFVEAALSAKELRAVVIKTFGAGNAPQKPWLLESFLKLRARGILVVNITQCSEGSVEMHRYETGLQLLNAGVENGHDSTIETCVTKLMVLLGEHRDTEQIRALLHQSIAGEITVP
ncbi:MAG: type I asparaginase [Alloprevotella sp.]|nr:type I asparaginase [Alloprevotella sp.]